MQFAKQLNLAVEFSQTCVVFSKIQTKFFIFSKIVLRNQSNRILFWIKTNFWGKLIWVYNGIPRDETELCYWDIRDTKAGMNILVLAQGFMSGTKSALFCSICGSGGWYIAYDAIFLADKFRINYTIHYKLFRNCLEENDLLFCEKFREESLHGIIAYFTLELTLDIRNYLTSMILEKISKELKMQKVANSTACII